MCSPGLCILRIERELFTVLNYCVITCGDALYFFYFFNLRDETQLHGYMLMFTYRAVLLGLLFYKYRREKPLNKEVMTFLKIGVVVYTISGLVALCFGDVGLARSYLAVACYFAFLVDG